MRSIIRNAISGIANQFPDSQRELRLSHYDLQVRIAIVEVRVAIYSKFVAIIQVRVAIVRLSQRIWNKSQRELRLSQRTWNKSQRELGLSQLIWKIATRTSTIVTRTWTIATRTCKSHCDSPSSRCDSRNLLEVYAKFGVTILRVRVLVFFQDADIKRFIRVVATHIQPLTPVSEFSEPPESPSPYLDPSAESAAAAAAQAEEEMEEAEELEQSPAAVPFSRLFTCADQFDWALMLIGALAAAAHGTAPGSYLHFFAKIVHVLEIGSSVPGRDLDEQFERHLNLQIFGHGYRYDPPNMEARIRHIPISDTPSYTRIHILSRRAKHH
ncbi:hypothetical protein F3Y22_tig00112114pilonHSYRG00200 [Hibiscus syriacus]|uniref:Uncharacterized protein n=1 Tax=Hibiscus syriacus TaxID=106335 RepID=A0A6A2XLN0_HIBSY|nr:hypothetical protein F3Y22_tig00112114pilonHSYRG00200 [Hibiscus syriacus]